MAHLHLIDSDFRSRVEATLNLDQEELTQLKLGRHCCFENLLSLASLEILQAASRLAVNSSSFLILSALQVLHQHSVTLLDSPSIDSVFPLHHRPAHLCGLLVTRGL